MTEHETQVTEQAHAAYQFINRDNWTVLAVGADKRPLGKWAPGGRNRFDYTNALDLFAHYPDAVAFGVVAGASGLVIIDLDSADAIRKWFDHFGEPQTRVAKTPRGRHLYYLAPPDLVIGPAVQILPGVDIRGGESYAITPPSHTTGGEYEWANDLPFAPLPAEVIDVLVGAAPREPERIPMGEPVPEGKRNDDIFHHALKLKRADVPHDAAVTMIRAHVAEHHAGTITENEIIETVGSAYRHDERHPPMPTRTVEDVIDTMDDVDVPNVLSVLEPLDLRTMMVTDPPPIKWVWEDYVAAGTLNLLHGDAGLGKSLISLAIAARTTVGIPLLDRDVTAGNVVMIDAENSLDEIHRRIRSAFDRISNVDRFTYYRTTQTILGSHDAMVELFATVKHETDADLIILDSQRALWDGDEREQAEAGRMLRSLARVAEGSGAAILVIHHDTKAGQYSGSSDISAAVTGSRLHLKRAARAEDADADNWNERMLVHAKCRIGAEQPVERFRIEIDTGIDLVRAGPTADLEHVGQRIVSWASLNPDWPRIATEDIHREFGEMNDRRRRGHIYAHLEAMGVIEHAPKHGERRVTFVSQTAL
jgi:hypothetical protein